VQAVQLEGQADPAAIYLRPQTIQRATIDCVDPDGDSLTFEWDVRTEVEVPANSYAGSLERPAQPIPGLIQEPQGPSIRFVTPTARGAYRLFVRALDGHGHVGYANLPFFVSTDESSGQSDD
jgi:hypothetical protein